MVTFVTSKDKVLLTLLAMLKGPFKKVSLLLTTAMLKVLGSPAVDVQLMALEVLKTQNSELEGARIENVAKAYVGKRATAAAREARIMSFVSFLGEKIRDEN